jgi:hypothetical protein
MFRFSRRQLFKGLSRRRVLLVTIASGLLFSGELETAHADTYPVQLLGAWGGRGAFMGDDNPKVAAAACESYKKNPKAVTGDLLVFQGSQKFSYGGYADYVDKNISVKQIAADQWEIIDRHYNDEEGGGKAGYKNVTYKISVSGDIITKTEGKYRSRFSKCVSPVPQPPVALPTHSAPPAIAAPTGRATTQPMGKKDNLPQAIGRCIDTSIAKISDRFGNDISSHASNNGFSAGTAIEYTNDGFQVSYDRETAVVRSRVGDKVRMCLVYIPENCPPGDERGRIYTTTNLRTGEAWTLPDAQHSCGGA